MANFINKTKSAAFSAINVTKNVMTMIARIKAGTSWTYGQTGYTYGMLSDPNVGEVYYGQVGDSTTSSVTNKTKN